MGTASADPARRKPVAIATGATSGMAAAAAEPCPAPRDVTDPSVCIAVGREARLLSVACR